MLPGLLGPAGKILLGFDELFKGVPTIVELLDEAIKQLDEGRGRACRPSGPVAPRHKS
jgi:hypothetical protein